MSRSLIRKNQLHPDIADLVSEYGSGFFISIGSSGDLINSLAEIVSGDFANTVRLTGNQTISGIKTFASRPTVNGTGVLLSGDFGLEKSLTPNLYLRTSSKDTDGNNAGGIVSAVSEDGIKWTSLSRNVNFPSFSRDASTIWYNNKWVSVYTNAFTSTGKNFGIATSTNLTSWITGAPVLLSGAATPGVANNVWAPEWFVDSGQYYVLVRLSTTAGNNYGAPGMGYVRALNPGTWTSWTEWTPFDNSVRTDANDFSIVKKDNLYWLFSHGGTHLSGSQPLGLDIVNNITLQYSETPFSGYSSLVEITEPLRGIIRSGDNSAFFEGPSVVNIGGSHWRLYFQDGIDNSVWSIDSFNDFQSWPTDSLRKNLYEGFNGGGHGTVFKIDEKNFVGLNQSLRDINSPISIGAVALTGNQTISGIKTFRNRPIFDGSGLATIGELGGSTNFNGNRAITRSSINGVTPGGTDVVTFLNNLFYPFVGATISLNSYSLQELGTTFGQVPFNGSITQNSETVINNLQYMNGNTVLSTVPNPNFGNFSSGFALNLITNTELKARVTANNNGSPSTITASRNVIFEAPSYAGSGIDNLQSNPANMKLVLSGQNFLSGNNGKTVMQEPSSFQVQVYTNNSWFYIVYPSGWGALTKIANPQLGDFNINTDFTQGFVTLTLNNNVTTHPYRYYKRTLPTTLTNYPVIYYF